MRRGFHALLAGAGWLVFLYLWWTVFVRGFARESWLVLSAVTFLLVAIALLNFLWIRFNEGIARTRTPRTGLPPITPAREHDTLGRPLTVNWPEVQVAPTIRITIDANTGGKVYRAEYP